MGNVTCFKRIDLPTMAYEMSDLQTFPDSQQSKNIMREEQVPLVVVASRTGPRLSKKTQTS